MLHCGNIHLRISASGGRKPPDSYRSEESGGLRPPLASSIFPLARTVSIGQTSARMRKMSKFLSFSLYSCWEDSVNLRPLTGQEGLYRPQLWRFTARSGNTYDDLTVEFLAEAPFFLAFEHSISNRPETPPALSPSGTGGTGRSDRAYDHDRSHTYSHSPVPSRRKHYL